MKNFELLATETVQQACSYLSQYQEDAKVIAGGHLLLILLRHPSIEPSFLIDLKTLSDLEYFSFGDTKDQTLAKIN